MNKKTSNLRMMFGHGAITTGDEGGGITHNDDESATDPEMDFKSILNVLNKNPSHKQN
jgi:hypothetical protein